MNREEVINSIVANCDCWKGQETTLNSFDDAMLGKLKATVDGQKATLNCLAEVAANAGAPSGLTLNEMPAFIKKKMKAKEPDEDEEEDDDDEDDDDEEPTKNRRRQPMTAEQWLAAAPPEIQSAVHNSMEIEKRERKRLIDKITANVDAGAKKELVETLVALPLKKLRTFQALAPAAPVHNQIEDISYFGAEGGVNNLTANEEDDILELPTVNFEEERKQKV